MDQTRSTFIRRFAGIALSAILFAGCVDLSSPSEKLGRLLVSVKDANSVGVAGIAVDLYLEDGKTFWTGLRTTADGSGEFRAADGGLIPRVYIARIVLSGTYSLAAGETNDKAVTVNIGQTQTVNFKVARSVTGQN